jgi:hypothetical protein
MDAFYTINSCKDWTVFLVTQSQLKCSTEGDVLFIMYRSHFEKEVEEYSGLLLQTPEE